MGHAADHLSHNVRLNVQAICPDQGCDLSCVADVAIARWEALLAHEVHALGYGNCPRCCQCDTRQIGTSLRSSRLAGCRPFKPRAVPPRVRCWGAVPVRAAPGKSAGIPAIDASVRPSTGSRLQDVDDRGRAGDLLDISEWVECAASRGAGLTETPGGVWDSTEAPALRSGPQQLGRGCCARVHLKSFPLPLEGWWIK